MIQMTDLSYIEHYGSQLNFMTMELSRKLKLMYQDERRSFSGVNQNKTESRKIVQVTLKTRNKDIECLLLPSEQVPDKT